LVLVLISVLRTQETDSTDKKNVTAVDLVENVYGTALSFPAFTPAALTRRQKPPARSSPYSRVACAPLIFDI
jgi:hypothetical protein